jgi:lipoprotein-anchoring transpeptidase ErfK/SrfK
VAVALTSVREELRHLRPFEGSRPSGEYDAQEGDEVVTNLRRGAQPLVKLDGMQRAFRLLGSVLLAVLLAGCGASNKEVATAKPAAMPKQAAIPSPPIKRPAAAIARRCSWTRRPVGSPRVTVAAVVRGHARVFRAPGRRLLASFGRLNQNGYPTVFRVLAAVRGRNCGSAWYRVQLPMRPNGVSGYVRTQAVELVKVRTKIEIDLSSRRLTFLRNGRRVLRTTVAVGTSATPTPTGAYYVNQKLIPSDPGGPYGPGAIGISAFSPVLTGWAQGGPVGIHGTNEPWAIGHAVSNGCIRLRNPALRRLFAATPAGTPVLIRR